MEELRYSQIKVSCSTYLIKHFDPGAKIRFEIYKLDEVLLGDVAGAEVSDPIDGHDPNVLNGAKQILKKSNFMERNSGKELTLKEMRYLHTPDLSVDLISSSRWSRITSLMNSYLLNIHIFVQKRCKKLLQSRKGYLKGESTIDLLTMQGSLLSLQFSPL